MLERVNVLGSLCIPGCSVMVDKSFFIPLFLMALNKLEVQLRGLERGGGLGMPPGRGGLLPFTA